MQIRVGLSAVIEEKFVLVRCLLGVETNRFVTSVQHIALNYVVLH